MRSLHPRRVLLVAAVALAGAGVASAVTAPEADLVSVSTATHDTTATTTATLRPGSSRPTSTVTAPPAAPSTTVAPARSTATTRPRPAPATTPTTQPTTRPTTSTTIDWRAAGLPGPVGSTIQPYTQAPYVVSAAGGRSGLTVQAAANGARPGETMRLTIDASWVPFRNTGSITIVGPMDYTKPADQQRTRVLTSWSTPCDQLSFLDPGELRSVTVDLPMQPIVKPEFTMNNLEYEVFTTQTACGEGGGIDAWLQLSFNVAEPWVVVAPSPGFGLPHTG